MGICISKPAGVRRHPSLSVSRRIPAHDGGLSDPNADKMKGIFKVKPRTPVDIVRQTRDILSYLNDGPNLQDTKHDEKVSSLLISICNFEPCLRTAFVSEKDD